MEVPNLPLSEAAGALEETRGLAGRLDRPEEATLELAAALRRARDAREHLGRYIELAGVPDELTERIALVPALYNPEKRRFEFQRTPNLYPTGRIVVAGAGSSVTPLDQLAAFGGMAGGGPFDVDPVDSRVWKLLGGIVWASAAVNLLVRPDGGRRAFGGAILAAAGAQTFTLPGNGAQVVTQIKRSFEIAITAAAAVNVDLILFVAEEPREEMVRSRSDTLIGR